MTTHRLLFQRSASAGAIPDSELDRLAALGFDYLWLMGVWSTGSVGPAISRTMPGVRAELDVVLPGWTDADVVGSPYAIARYSVDPRFGGDAALADLRRRLAKRSMGLVVDFVPNHTARDHHWITEQPGLYVHDDRGVAAGKDPYGGPWADTAQLDLRLAATHDALLTTLDTIADRADGVRCDMAMLVLSDVFEATWRHRPPAGSRAAGEFWARAIDSLAKRPFIWIAEAYWGLEPRLQQLGFDFTYDKTLYDRSIHGDAAGIRDCLAAGLEYQQRSLRFLENHDEPRLAASLPREQAIAALAILLTAPGLRLVHDGQLEGRRLRMSVHASRRADEPGDAAMLAAHERLLEVARLPAVRSGSFAVLRATDVRIVAVRWEHDTGAVVVIVNYAPVRVQARVVVELHGIAARKVTLRDQLDGAVYERDGDELLDPSRGLYVDLAPWQAHVLAR